jgi:hypothetical protein
MYITYGKYSTSSVVTGTMPKRLLHSRFFDTAADIASKKLWVEDRHGSSREFQGVSSPAFTSHDEDAFPTTTDVIKN